MAVEHVEAQPSPLHTVSAGRNPSDRRRLQTVRSRNGDQRCHFADSGREAFNFVAKRLITGARALAHAETDTDRDGDGEGVDGQELGHGDGGHGDGTSHDHDRGQQRVGHLLEHQLDVLNVPNHLGLHDRRVHSRVIADRQTLQASGQHVTKFGSGVAHHGHEVACVNNVIRIILNQQHGGQKAPPQNRFHVAANSHDVDDGGGDHRQKPEWDLLQREGDKGQGHPPGTPCQESNHRSNGMRFSDDNGRLGKRFLWHGINCSKRTETPQLVAASLRVHRSEHIPPIHPCSAAPATLLQLR